jgi:hypothetical protein
MKKFLVIYRMDMEEIRKMMANTSPESQKESMAEWVAWMEANKASFADGGAPVGKNTKVSASGAAEESNDVGGYAIMQGDSKEDVARVLAGSPHLKMPSATCDVMEILPM